MRGSDGDWDWTDIYSPCEGGETDEERLARYHREGQAPVTTEEAVPVEIDDVPTLRQIPVPTMAELVRGTR